MTKKFICILLVLAVALVAMPAMATGSFYESKYAPAVIETPSIGSVIYIGTACNTNLFSKEFTITRVTNPQNIQFTNGAVVTKEYADLFPAVNASPFEGELYGTGYWSTTNWAPGIFIVKLIDGNAGDPEYAVFETIAGQTTTIMFQGHAAYIPVETPALACLPVYTIDSASYGASTCTQEEIVQHNGDYTREWVDGYCARYWHGSCVDYRPGHYDYDYVGMGNGDYIRHHGDYRYVTPTITHPCVPDGEVIDVTSNVQSVASAGVTKFLFSNAHASPEGEKYYGGIWDVTDSQILSEIEDPAEDIVKDVTITYNNGCGTTKTIETKEYCIINLADGSATCPQTES